MGLLDDAIRDHLELKRRRGADPAEMERLEREALGPVRRGPDESGEVALQSQDPDDALYSDEPAADWPEPASGAEPSLDQVPQAGQPLPSAESALFDHELNGEQPSGADVSPEPAFSQESPAAPAPEPEPAQPVDDVNAETAEYDVEAEHGHESVEAADDSGRAHGRQQAEDVLEETPEFLQDTPDHDRLWFEQRPPKDFDFDE